MAESSPVRFNVNALVIGILLAVVLSAMGFSEQDPTLQWIVPGVVLLASVAAGMFWPQKPKKARGASRA